VLVYGLAGTGNLLSWALSTGEVQESNGGIWIIGDMKKKKLKLME
jgi:hypothetical protein